MTQLTVPEIQAKLRDLSVDYSDCFDKDSLRERLIRSTKEPGAKAREEHENATTKDATTKDATKASVAEVDYDKATGFEGAEMTQTNLPRAALALPTWVTGADKEVVCLILVWDLESQALRDSVAAGEFTEVDICAQIRAYIERSRDGKPGYTLEDVTDICRLATIALNLGVSGVRSLGPPEYDGTNKDGKFHHGQFVYEKRPPATWRLESSPSLSALPMANRMKIAEAIAELLNRNPDK